MDQHHLREWPEIGMVGDQRFLRRIDVGADVVRQHEPPFGIAVQLRRHLGGLFGDAEVEIADHLGQHEAAEVEVLSPGQHVEAFQRNPGRLDGEGEGPRETHGQAVRSGRRLERLRTFGRAVLIAFRSNGRRMS